MTSPKATFRSLVAAIGRAAFVTAEFVNRSGNRPSHEGAAALCDEVIALCQQAGFGRILLRGDTDFSQTEHLNRWDGQGVQFHFGYDAMPHLKEIAEENEEITVAKVNVDQQPELAAQYGIRSIPTMLFFKDGEVVHFEPRHAIEGRDAPSVAFDFVTAFDEHC